MRARTPAALLLAAPLLASCGLRGGGPGGGIEHPKGTDQLVLRIDTAGGLLPPGFEARRIPEVSLFGDGRIVTEGPQIEIYPGPALPNMLVREVTEDGIQAILEAARDAGLMGADRTYGYGCVTDAGTTTFTLRVDGERHVVSAYALGLDERECPGADLDARAKLTEFEGKLGDLGRWVPPGSLGKEKPYEPSELRVYVQPYSDAPDQRIVEPVANWPVETPLASFGEKGTVQGMRCGLVSGDELTSLLPKARGANELTPWRSGGEDFLLHFRPLLPDEHGCRLPTYSQ